MFRRPKPPTTGPFSHESGCPVARSDPDFDPPWQLVDEGRWQRTCQCTTEWTTHLPGVPTVDPYSPDTMRHAPQCEYRDTTDLAILKAILTVKPGAAGGYLWVSCVHCECSWPVPNILEGAKV
jgi:hypothetical protein